jgi:hypothetical protein
MRTTNIREIVEPFSNVSFNSTTFGSPIRKPHNLDYVKANQRWWIGVRFDSDADVAMFEKVISESSIRLLEFKGRFFVEHPHIRDDFHMGQVERYINHELPRLNAAVKMLCPHYTPAHYRCMVELFENGHGNSIVSTTGVVHGSDEFPAIVAFLNGGQTDFAALLNLYTEDENVRDALFFFGASGNPWPNLYKVREIVEEAVGGETQVVNKGWCSRNSIERFNRTANHQEAIGAFSRHARARAMPPPTPMDQSEARTLIGTILYEWIQELLHRKEGSGESVTT